MYKAHGPSDRNPPCWCNLNQELNMSNEQANNLGLTLDADTLAAFESGESVSKFLLEEGVYDAVVRGYVIKQHTFEGEDHGPKIQLIWQLTDGEGLVHSLLGKRWKLSADERSVFRKEICKWFNKNDWATVVDILKKGGILVADTEGAHFELDKFIGKKGKLMVNQVTSKKGKTFNDIVSISPAAKNAKDIAIDDIPEWMVDNALDYRLEKGIKIREQGTEETNSPDDKTPMNNVLPTDAKFTEDDLPF